MAPQADEPPPLLSPDPETDKTSQTTREVGSLSVGATTSKGATSLKKSVSSSSRAGLALGYKRHTFILSENLLRRLRQVAFDEERPIKDVVEDALRLYLDAR